MSDHIAFVLFIGFFFLILIALVVFLIKKVKKYKKVADSLEAYRVLNNEDLKSIQFLEIDKNLSIIPFVNRSLPKRKEDKKVWKFSNCTFSIISTYRRSRKRDIYLFLIIISGEEIEVIIPDIFLPYIKVGGVYYSKNIEISYRLDHFVLFDIEGVIGYNSLYEKFQLEQKTIKNSSLKRQPTKEELNAFTFSKWSNTWGILLPVFFPICIIGLISKETGVIFALLLPILIVTVLFYKAYQKGKKYIASRMVHFLKGTLWFDEEKYVYRINEDELKLHRKWRKVIQSKKLPIYNV